jgi:peptidoglycan hydrolase-like protein with peptidoglycan-binding domain
MVRRGDQGDAVRAVQSQLASRGVDVAVDGDFGQQTERAVQSFQRAKGLAVDGIVGPGTWAALVAGA